MVGVAEIEVVVVVGAHVTDAKVLPIMLEIVPSQMAANAILATRLGIFIRSVLIRLKYNSSRRADLQRARSVDWQVMWPARARNYQRRT